jgi:hypothetical protein
MWLRVTATQPLIQQRRTTTSLVACFTGPLDGSSLGCTCYPAIKLDSPAAKAITELHFETNLHDFHVWVRDWYFLVALQQIVRLHF